MNQRVAPWKSVFSLLLALVYGASPIDLIPDFIPLLGWLDDAAIVPVLLILAFFQYKRAQKRTPGNVIVMPPKR